MAKILAPFTEKQVEALLEWQSGSIAIRTGDGGLIIAFTHPFTCCSHNGCDRLKQPNEGALIPSTEGWICPCGNYTQDWCHDFMVNPTPNG